LWVFGGIHNAVSLEGGLTVSRRATVPMWQFLWNGLNRYARWS
jgi:hypothetical protein